jgi:hypothetical protein
MPLQKRAAELAVEGRLVEIDEVAGLREDHLLGRRQLRA